MISADDISLRQFGPAFERKCRNPKVIMCARIECQRANQCQDGMSPKKDGTK